MIRRLAEKRERTTQILARLRQMNGTPGLILISDASGNLYSAFGICSEEETFALSVARHNASLEAKATG